MVGQRRAVTIMFARPGRRDRSAGSGRASPSVTTRRPVRSQSICRDREMTVLAGPERATRRRRRLRGAGPSSRVMARAIVSVKAMGSRRRLSGLARSMVRAARCMALRARSILFSMPGRRIFTAPRPVSRCPYGVPAPVRRPRPARRDRETGARPRPRRIRPRALRGQRVGKSRQLVLQARKIVSNLNAEHVGPGREELAELDISRPQPSQAPRPAARPAAPSPRPRSQARSRPGAPAAAGALVFARQGRHHVAPATSPARISRE